MNNNKPPRPSAPPNSFGGVDLETARNNLTPITLPQRTTCTTTVDVAPYQIHLDPIGSSDTGSDQGITNNSASKPVLPKPSYLQPGLEGGGAGTRQVTNKRSRAPPVTRPRKPGPFGTFLFICETGVHNFIDLIKSSFQTNCNQCTVITSIIFIIIFCFLIGLMTYYIGVTVTLNGIKEFNRCGVPVIKPQTIQGRVYGGDDGIPYSWPWVVFIKIDPNEICGGSILNEEWILTATHCVRNKPLHNVTVTAGKYRLVQEAQEQIRAVKEIIVHDDFDLQTYNKDIALLRLAKPLKLNAFASKICFTQQSFTENYPCFLAGWGHTHGSAQHHILNQAMLPITKCPSIMGTTNYMICAGYHKALADDACEGDSGSALVCKRNDHWFQAGIVSWGYDCVKSVHPGVYVNVIEFIDWIRDHTEIDDLIYP